MQHTLDHVDCLACRRELLTEAIQKLDELITILEKLPQTKKIQTTRWKYLATSRVNLVFLRDSLS